MSEIHAGPLPQAAPDGELHPGPLKRSGNLRRATEAWRGWWRQRREQKRATRLARADVQAGPLPQADPDGEHHPGPLPKAAQAQRAKKTWREKRWERRRRRRFTEEVMGWVLVPVILISGFWAVKAGLNALGTNFTALVQGIKTALSAAGKA